MYRNQPDELTSAALPKKSWFYIQRATYFAQKQNFVSYEIPASKQSPSFPKVSKLNRERKANEITRSWH